MSALSFRFRPVAASDISAVRALIRASVLGLTTPDYSAATIEGALNHALDLDEQLVADGTYFLVEPVGAPDSQERCQIAGCGGWSYRGTLCGGDALPNREMRLLDPTTEAAKIRGIYVHPDWARLGLGTLILKYCEDAAAAAGFRHFEMGSTLTGAHLYALRGYQPRERCDIALPNGEMLGVLRMTKDLAS